MGIIREGMESLTKENSLLSDPRTVAIPTWAGGSPMTPRPRHTWISTETGQVSMVTGRWATRTQGGVLLPVTMATREKGRELTPVTTAINPTKQLMPTCRLTTPSKPEQAAASFTTPANLATAPLTPVFKSLLTPTQTGATVTQWLCRR